MHEDEVQRQMRRMRAAERMRNKRLHETQDQRNLRKQSLALRGKNRWGATPRIKGVNLNLFTILLNLLTMKAL